MSGALVQRHSGREPNPTLKPLLLHERPRPILDVLDNLCHRHARLDRLSCMGTNESVDLGRATDGRVGRFRGELVGRLEGLLLGGGVSVRVAEVGMGKKIGRGRVSFLGLDGGGTPSFPS